MVISLDVWIYKDVVVVIYIYTSIYLSIYLSLSFSLSLLGWSEPTIVDRILDRI